LAGITASFGWLARLRAAATADSPIADGFLPATIAAGAKTA